MHWRSIFGLMISLCIVLVKSRNWPPSKKRSLRGMKHLANIEWGWDTWCHHQPKVGNCSAAMKLHYYDTMTTRCRQFLYSGCNGNHNQFGSLRDCEQYCQGVSMNPEGRSKFTADLCAMQPNPGVCLGYNHRFYYNVNSKDCEAFVYSGCGGNANRFTTRKNCLDLCGKSGA